MPKNIKDFLLKSIPKHPNDIVAVATKHFDVTRTTIHRHLNTLHEQNKIIKSGTTKQIKYYLPQQENRVYQFSLKNDLSEQSIWDEFISPVFNNLTENVLNILHYGFTEMYNNGIDHSQGTKINVSIQHDHNNIKLVIEDNGIGVFKRINQIFKYSHYQESLLHLTKGRLTTDPRNHSGEGIFFTSRIFDKFYLSANDLCYFRDNVIDDWSVIKSEQKNGTQIILEISKNSTREMTDIFNKYTELEDYTFCKTDLLVDLSTLGEATLISRSQAKRLLMNIEPFTTLTLDFSKIRLVGQGFVDEVFRVYPLKNPQVKINYIHANENVEFMIKRGIPKS